VTPDDVVRSVPRIAAACDQPFGNSSVVPAYWCAQMAKDAGIECHALRATAATSSLAATRAMRSSACSESMADSPRLSRHRLLEPAILGRASLKGIPVLGKAQSYVEQARIDMPDRLHAYNLLLRVGVTDVLTEEFLSNVDQEKPLREQRATYEHRRRRRSSTACWPTTGNTRWRTTTFPRS
jgi:asparagine synthase (glutamine-hydrolysing)